MAARLPVGGAGGAGRGAGALLTGAGAGGGLGGVAGGVRPLAAAVFDGQSITASQVAAPAATPRGAKRLSHERM
jgi:hypothetical protein